MAPIFSRSGVADHSHRAGFGMTFREDAENAGGMGLHQHVVFVRRQLTQGTDAADPAAMSLRAAVTRS